MVERKKDLSINDILFYRITNLQKQNYDLQFTAMNLSKYPVAGFVEDIYLNTETSLNMEGVTDVNFIVTSAAASYASNRFRIVFKKAIALPVTVTSIQAIPKTSGTLIKWQSLTKEEFSITNRKINRRY